MSDGLNRATVLGNLGADPDLRVTAKGDSLLRLSVATSKTWLKDGEKHESTEWHRVVVWGKRGEALSRILRKGARVYAEGELKTSSYDKNGEKHYSTVIIASDIILCGSPPGGDAQRGNRSAHGSVAKHHESSDDEYLESDDDIPF